MVDYWDIGGKVIGAVFSPIGFVFNEFKRVVQERKLWGK
jgi:hypothetical protein